MITKNIKYKHKYEYQCNEKIVINFLSSPFFEVEITDLFLSSFYLFTFCKYHNYAKAH